MNSNILYTHFIYVFLTANAHSHDIYVNGKMAGKERESDKMKEKGRVYTTVNGMK